MRLPSVGILRKRLFRHVLLALAVSLPIFIFAFSRLLSTNPFPLDKLEACPESPVLLDRHGSVVNRNLGRDGQWRIPVELSSISRRLKQATIAVEDERFYAHHGVDPISVGRAVMQNLFAAKVVSGASTLDMQLCRMLDPQPRTFNSKIIEASRAWRTSEKLSKNEVLEAYLNLAPYGGNLSGVEAASLRYFGKSAKELSLSEAALLAGLPQSPSKLRPDLFPDRAAVRREKVLERMLEEGMISREEAQRAKLEPVRVKSYPLTARNSRHFVAEAIRRRHSGGKAFLDLQLQSTVEALVEEHLKTLPVLSEASVVMIELETGGLSAMVGGSNFDNPNGGQVNAALAWRSPGSTLKPFIYAAAALERRLDGHTLLPDRPVNLAGWTPENFNRNFSDRVNVGDALRFSLNLPALRVAREVGACKASGLAEACGISFRADPVGRGGLAFVLGAVETRLIDLANAYATLGRGGVRRDVRFFLDEPMVDCRILEKQVCLWLSHELSSRKLPSQEFRNLSIEATPWFMRKTGTSSGRRDAWAVGHNGKFAIGVWVGRTSGMGDAAFVGSRAAEPLLARIFDLPEVRELEAPPHFTPWTIGHPLNLFDEDSQLVIVTPQTGSVFRRVNEFVEVVPRASLNHGLTWFLNGSQLVGEGMRKVEVGIGRHELLCLTPEGSFARSSFEVH